MSCYNCEKEKAFHLADGLWLCGDCESSLSKHEQLKIQADRLGCTVSDITAAENRRW